MKRYKYEILSGVTGSTFQVPIFLEDSVDEMGVMVGFDGEFEQIEQYANFTYKSGFAWSAYGYYNSAFGSNSAACGSSAAANNTFYIKEQYSQPTGGQYVYTNKSLTTAFNGGYGYWRMQRDDGQWFAAHIAPWGMMFSVLKCTPYVSPIPSPTPSETPCPVNPSVTPSVTPTKSIPATPTPTPSLSPTPTPSVTETPCPVSATPTPTLTPTVSPTSTPAVSPTNTPTSTPAVSPTSTPAVSPTSTPAVSPTRTETPTPTPTTSHILVPQITLWAVGGNGVVKSTDEGVTWTLSYTGDTLLNGVSFLNANDGFAVGGVAKAFKTSNGGSSWSDNSWALPGTISTRILYSTTHQLSTDIYVGGNSSTFIRYNGSTWSDVSKGTSHNAYNLYAFNSSTVLSTTSISGAADYGLRTTNSGGSWSEPATFPQDQVVLGVDFYGINGIMSSARNSTTNKIFRSSDSGVSWSAQSGPTVAAMRAVSMPSASVAYMVGGDQAALWGAVWKSTNGGANWTDITGNLPANTRKLHSVVFFDENKGWATSNFSKILYTTNGGSSWTSVEANVDNNHVLDIMMIVEYV